MSKVGIEKLFVYPTSMAINLETLATHRGHEVKDLQLNLMVKERSVNPLWEDPVTMAVNAAQLLLSETDKKDIGLLIVATESSVDQEKTISSWVHGFLELPSDCRNFEIKSACYSGTAAMQIAIAWILAKRNKNKKVLVVTTDQSLIALNQPYEYITGAGAVAMLISTESLLFEIEHEKTGVYAHEVTDVIRPLPWIEAGNSETSLFSYMEALNGAYDNYEKNVGQVNFNSYFNYHLYHVPFAGISFRAHKALLQRDAQLSKADCWLDFSKKRYPHCIIHNILARPMAGVFL